MRHLIRPDAPAPTHPPRLVSAGTCGGITSEITGITYVRGAAAEPSVKGVKIIAHVRNDIGGWERGFVLALSRRWSEPEAAYRAWHRDRASNDFALGAVQMIPVSRCSLWSGTSGWPA
ncbi:hypothetical protein [Streptomyces incanus]|uniref:Transglycosylase SLT domain-containing protein n=1 Tax=Streptomyces incanus TaxID=887453 RepID=A0ABW0XRS9_9ACTN